jgi:putative flippase GtrA
VTTTAAEPKRDARAALKKNGYCLTVVKRLKHYVLVRHGHNWVLLFRFALVGASGVFVNLFVAIMCKKLGPDENSIFFDLPLTDFNVRWYHIYSTIAFLVANLWNFELNRLWTFRSAKHAGWFREYFPFLTVGILAQIVGLGIVTPISFLLNKVWTFSSVRGQHRVEPAPENVESEHPTAGV